MPDFHVAMQRWRPLGAVAPDALAAARLQLHWAAQAVAAVGHTLGEKAPDDSHTSLEWFSELGVLAGSPTPAGIRAALRLADLALLLLDSNGPVGPSFPLNGKTLSSALSWLAEAIGSVRGSRLERPLERPQHELPGHDIGKGAPFASKDPAAFAELARWFDDADRVLRELQSATSGASAVRCWPHHFDIATLIVHDRDLEADTARSTGVGMTPGDASIPEPYWYVAPWPHPKDPEPPLLAGEGIWHTESWFGAVLTGSKLVAAGDGAAQALRLVAFLRSAMEGSRALLECGA